MREQYPETFALLLVDAEATGAGLSKAHLKSGQNGPKVLRSQSISRRALILFPCTPLFAAWRVFSVDNVKTSLSRRKPLNGAAEPGRDLLEIDVLDVTKSVRAKNRCNASRLETAGPTLINFLKLFGPLRY